MMKQDEESIIQYYLDGTSDRVHLVFQKKELKEILAEAVDRLPRNERLVVSLHYLEVLTTKKSVLSYALASPGFCNYIQKPC